MLKTDGTRAVALKEAKKWRLFGRDLDVWQILAGLLFLAYLVCILATFTDYGITIDEPPQADYGKEIVTWYMSFFRYEAFFDRIKLLDLERYGGFFDTVLYPITQISPWDVYETRHLCYALLGLAGVAGAYRVGLSLGGTATGFLAAAFLVLMPRYYAHTFNNPKDLPFAVFYIWSIYWLIRCLPTLPNLSRRLILATGLLIGLTLATRVGGLILFGTLGLFFVLRTAQAHVESGQPFVLDRYRRPLLQWGAIALLAWCVMLVFWPTAQRSPILFPIDALLNFSQYGTPDFTTTFFEGQRIDITAVPWYYAPRWFSLALPEFLFFGLAVGAILLICHVLRERKSLSFTRVRLDWVLLAWSAISPLATVVMLATPLYDGLRHFLFVVPPMAVLSAGGLVAAVREISLSWLRRVSVGIAAALMALTLFDMIRLHPNEGVYFNRFIAGGLREASKSYQTDYWENSHKQGVRWLDAFWVENRPNRKLRISAGGKNIQYQLNPDRYTFTDIPVEADFYLSTTRDDRHRMVPGEIVHTIKRDDVALLYIVRPDSTYDQDPFFADSEARDLHLAWKYMRAGDFKKTLATYAGVLANDPLNPMVYHNVAYAQYRLGNYGEAVAFSQKALRLKPGYVRARLFLGHALLAQGEISQAVAVYRDVIKADPMEMEAYQGLAKGLKKMGKVPEAIAAYKQAIRVAPEDATAYRDLGALLAEQGEFASAGDALQKAVSRDTTQAVTWYMLAQTRRLSGDLKSARDHILKAISLKAEDPEYRVEHLNVGRAYERVNDDDGALEVYRAAAKLYPPFAQAFLHLGALQMKKSAYAEAIRTFEAGGQAFQKDGHLYLGLAQAYERSNQIPSAVAAYGKVLSLIDSPEVRTHLEALLANANQN
ncbi:MAG: tetratricopeptide repeat protein [bacterium]|nr:tetratricopeptide repeat protein [bacterium]